MVIVWYGSFFFFLEILIITSIITSTSGTFPLFLIKHLDEWGLSQGGKFLWSESSPVPFPLFLLRAPLGESCKCHCQGTQRCPACRAPLNPRRTPNGAQVYNLLHSHVFRISQSCYWGLGFFCLFKRCYELCSTLGFSSVITFVTALAHNSILAVLKSALVVKILKILQFIFSISLFGTV